MNRPDFREIRRLIDSLRALDQNFQQMFAQAQALEAEIQAVCARVRRVQAVGRLAQIPVEELRNARAGIRVSALEEAGYHTLLDLYQLPDWKLQAVEGIGEKQAASIRSISETFLEKLAETGRIRLEIGTENESSKAQGQRDSRELSQDRIPGEFRDSDIRTLITLLCRYRQVALILRDAEPLREDLHAQIESRIQAVEIRDRLRWIFSRREKKERTVLAVGALMELARGPLCGRAGRLLSLYGGAVRTDEAAALDDFRKNSAPYYALLESLGGVRAPQETIYSSIPAQLAAQINAADLDLRAFKGNLRAYQAFGTRYILTQKRVLLGDEMGLGKTIQAIAAMAHLAVTEMEPRFLIVCPASVMINWCREIEKFSDVEPHLLHGTVLETSFTAWKKRGGAAVTNYESMGKIAPRIDNQMRLSLLVIDEAHYIKNPEAKRTRLIHSLDEESERILLMTGTPLENNVIEMCQLFDFVRPDMADAIRANAAMRRIPAFREMLAPAYLRRQRDQVLEELPPCTEEEEWCAMTPQDLEAYRACVLDKSFNGMRRVSFLQDMQGNTAVSAKMTRLRELCDQALDEGKKIVIYSFFRETIRKVAEMLEDIAARETAPGTGGLYSSEGTDPSMSAAAPCTGGLYTADSTDGAGGNHSEEHSLPAIGDGRQEFYIGEITGSTPAGDRQQIVDRFTETPGGCILLCQIQAGGTGLNIQAAEIVIFCEPQIKPSLTRQAIARVYRMGQTRNVLVYHLLCENTVDEAVRYLLETKQAEFDLFADESALADAADNLLDREWIHRFVEEEQRRYLPSLPT